MAQTLYFRLLIALCLLSECILRRYYHINMKTTWTEAQKYCREKYTDLATVNNINDMKQVTKSVNNSPNELIWIGLRRSNVYTWKWSLGDTVNYTNWYNGESNGPNNICAYLRNGTWHQQDCNVNMRFICYNESIKSYFIETSIKTWRDAQIFCRQHHTDLTSVRNQNENQQIEKIINDSQISVWIGLFRDSWEWSDESDSTFRYWLAGEPNNAGGSEDYTIASVIDQGQWIDTRGDSYRTFVCHEDKLILIQLNLNWPEALRYCRENHVDLISVDSKEIQYMVTEVIHRASTDAVWMGLHYYCLMNLWIWIRGEDVCYQNWAQENGTQLVNCNTEHRAGAVQSGRDHRWISLPQSHQLNFICIRKE